MTAPGLDRAALALLRGLALPLLRVRRAATRLHIWTLVLYAGLAMPALSALAPPIHWTLPPLPARWAASRVAPPELTPAVPVRLLPAVRRQSAHIANTAPPGSAAIVAPPLPAPASPLPRPFPWLPAAAGAYCAGLILLLLQMLLGWRLARRLARGARPIVATDLLQRLAQRATGLGLRRHPRLAFTAALTVPVTLGVAAPMVVLPANWRQWDAATLDAVLAHELAHIRRRDALIQRLSMLHRALFWFSPLPWWLHGHLVDLAEQASDEAVLAAGADRAGYAEILLGFFQAVCAKPERVRWQALAMARSRGAERRVERILSWQAAGPAELPRRWTLALAGVAVPVVFLVAAMQPAIGLQPASASGEAAAPANVRPATVAPVAIRQAPPARLPNPAPAAAAKSATSCADAFDAHGNLTPEAAGVVARCAQLDADEFAWMRAYVGHPAAELIQDSQYHAFVTLAVPMAIFHLGADISLTQAVNALMRGDAASVELRDGRYLSFSANEPRDTSAGVLFWVDLRQGLAFGAIAFNPSSGEPSPNLTVFSRQVDRAVTSEVQLPPALLAELTRWRASRRLPDPLPRYFIDDTGTRTVLMHADACAAGDGDAQLCQALNADDAEMDMKAALYLVDQRYLPGSAARAQLDAAQTRWIAYRDSTCGPAFPCRGRLTRGRATALADLYLHTLDRASIAAH